MKIRFQSSSFACDQNDWTPCPKFSGLLPLERSKLVCLIDRVSFRPSPGSLWYCGSRFAPIDYLVVTCRARSLSR